MKMVWRIEGNVLDLYCWAWSIWLSFLRMWLWEEVVWVEIVEDAIVDARHNAKINGLENKCYFVASPAEKMLINFPELEEKIKNIGLVIIDPPREWLHPNVINYLSNLKKQYQFKLLYISCNPITMARDIELLVEEWFKFKEIQPVDLFPHTHHIEDICVLNQ
jgi:23S rRNA (uracil1939-C5)-methyltransferase